MKNEQTQRPDSNISEKIGELLQQCREENEKLIGCPLSMEAGRELHLKLKNFIVELEKKAYREGFRAGSHYKKTNQEILLDYIKGYEAKNGISPTLEEMKVAIACKSLTSVQRALVSLEKQGLVTRDKYQKRAWRLNEN